MFIEPYATTYLVIADCFETRTLRHTLSNVLECLTDVLQPHYDKYPRECNSTNRSNKVIDKNNLVFPPSITFTQIGPTSLTARD